MKILSIGNSFSQDAHRYLTRVAKGYKLKIKAVNLYIGGCSLRTHYLNMLDDSATYDFEFCGEKTGIKVSIREALASDDWDYITLQQASPYSGHKETYHPYIEALAEYLRKYCPKAKILIHQTWAYADGSDKLRAANYESSSEMHLAAKEAYTEAAACIGAYGIIPAGDAMQRAINSGLAIHRDTFHASLGAGRYLLALTWLRAIFGIDTQADTFADFDGELTSEERAVVLDAVKDIEVIGQ